MSSVAARHTHTHTQAKRGSQPLHPCAAIRIRIRTQAMADLAARVVDDTNDGDMMTVVSV